MKSSRFFGFEDKKTTLLNVCAVVLVVLIVGASAFMTFRDPTGRPALNRGFGPEWDCLSPGRGGDICWKKMPTLPK